MQTITTGHRRRCRGVGRPGVGGTGSRTRRRGVGRRARGPILGAVLGLALGLAGGSGAIEGPGARGVVPAQAGETVFAEPPPGFDTPRRILLQLSTDDPKVINNTLWNAVNLQKFYGFDSVQITIVAFGPGMAALYKDSPVRDRIESQLKFDIAYIGCKNTMDTTGRSPEDLIDGVTWVQAGIAEIVERQLRGWVYVSPGL